MRGKEKFAKWTGEKFGITPAYAGKSRKESCKPSLQRDHPRICGEKFTNKEMEARHEGSPPHMRGKVVGSLFDVNGNLDHPRICGEKGVL